MAIEGNILDAECRELENRYSSNHRNKNSFYVDEKYEMKDPPGSANILGEFAKYTYNYDLSGEKIIKTEI